MSRSKEIKRQHKSRDENGMAYEYSVWKSMLTRCQRNTSYADCFVADEWLDFQNFAEWLKNNDFYGLGYDLDKDILSRDTKLYSPETCVLVPRHINIIFCQSIGRSDSSGLPAGVHLQRRHKYKKYGAQVSTNGTRKHLGYFECPQEAHQAYVLAKEAYVKEVANEWRGRIDERVYDALMNWRVVDEVA